MTKITVITPTYNSGKYIAKNIISVINQNIEVEHIIIDNLSTDNTKEVIKSYIEKMPINDKKYTLRYIREKDLGQSDAINKGIKEATGNIISWLNADEFYCDNALSYIALNFGLNDEIIYGNSRFVSPSHELIKIKQEAFFSRGMLKYYGCYIPSCATFFSSKILKNNYLDINLKISMDWDLYLSLSYQDFRFRYINKDISNFIITGENISQINPIRRNIEYDIIRERYNIYITKYKIIRKIMLFVLPLYWISIRNILRLKRIFHEKIMLGKNH